MQRYRTTPNDTGMRIKETKGNLSVKPLDCDILRLLQPKG